MKVKVKSLGRVRLFATPQTEAYQAPPSMGFSRQECWSGLPLPSPRDLPDPGIKPGSPTLQADTLLSEPPAKQPKYLAIKILLNSSIHSIVQNTAPNSNKIGELFTYTIPYFDNFV